MKLTTGIRKRFRVSNKVKKVAPRNRFRLCISRSSKVMSECRDIKLKHLKSGTNN